jgi:N-methylhydantoinase B
VIELVEKECPLVIWEWGTTLDGAGAGKHRGGFGPFMTIESFADTTCIPLLDSSNFAPVPIQGGAPGMTTYGMLLQRDENGRVTSWNGIYPADKMTPLFGKFDDEGRPDPQGGTFGNGTRFMSAKTQIVLAPGEVIRLQTAAAAGCGDPLERDPELVLKDVLNERVSLRQAREVYGVVLDAPGTDLDRAATNEERDRLRAGQEGERPITTFTHWPITQHEFDSVVDEMTVASVGG